MNKQERAKRSKKREQTLFRIGPMFALSSSEKEFEQLMKKNYLIPIKRKWKEPPTYIT